MEPKAPSSREGRIAVNDGLQAKHAKKRSVRSSISLNDSHELSNSYPRPPPIQPPTPLARPEGRRLTPILVILELAFNFWCPQGVKLLPQACPTFEGNNKGRRRAAALRKRMCSPSGSLINSERQTNTRLPPKERTTEYRTRQARL